MRPAQQISAPDVWIVREQASFKLLKPLNRASEPGPSSRQPFRRSQSDSQLLLTPQGERYIYMSTKLYVGNLAFQTTSEELQKMFAQVGTVQSASVVEDRETGRSRGFAFVEMSTSAEAEAAIGQFNGKELGGRPLKVNEAKPRENRTGGGGGRSFNDRYRAGNNGGGGAREPRW